MVGNEPRGLSDKKVTLHLWLIRRSEPVANEHLRCLWKTGISGAIVYAYSLDVCVAQNACRGLVVINRLLVL